MTVTVSEYADVRLRAEELNLNVPIGLAVLPVNFLDAATHDDLLHQDHTATVRSLWRQHGVEESRLEREGERIPALAERSFTEWIAPTIFIGSALLSQNSTAVTIALNVLSSYLADILRGHPGAQVRLAIVEECPAGDAVPRYRKVEYVGDVEGLKNLPAVLHEVYARGE